MARPRPAGFGIVAALGLAVGLVAQPSAVPAQSGAKVRTIGLLELAPPTASVREAFRQGLAEHGWVSGRTIQVVERSAGGHAERLPALAADLVALRVEVIVTSGTTAIRAARDATGTIPIVFAASADPVTAGFAKSLARPGGNATGLSIVPADLLVRRLALLKEALPRTTRVGILAHAANPANPTLIKALNDATPGLQVSLRVVQILQPRDLDPAFDTLKAERVQAVLVLEDPVFTAHAERLAELARRRRLPTVLGNRYLAEVGGLMAYGVIHEDLWRRAAGYVDKILKGASPGELAIEQPHQYDLVINLKTARALRVAVPPAILIRANLVIE